MSTRAFSKREAIRYGWSVMTANLGFFIGLLIVMGVILLVPGVLGRFTEEPVLQVHFLLLIPIYAHFEGERAAVKPLLIQKEQGSARMLLPEKPRRVTLNDDHEALVRLVE